ncbi:Uracil-DNA glycosylase, family 4 [hydrothermal vent metagenome]|uniref:Type-4 uracil-DNA glycosylase n=1 Tax=hydrothermal vent metagenome TaxID=652676 RepID=A0A3B1CP02_9ZZZZ
MRPDEILSEKLARLKLQLETLKLHGHKFVEFTGDNNWIAKLGEQASGFAPALPAGSGELKDNVAVVTPGKASSGAGKIESVAKEVESCELCPLAKSRTNTVFGVGDAKARLMFIGEAPGRDEDLKGEPFVGRAGKLLTDMIKAMGYERGDVYIANIIKCRPPGNRNPEPAEVDNCEPYLKRQINIIKPEIICALGAVAAQTLLKTKTPISKLRGRFHQYQGAPLLPTFHPAYLLRNPSAKTEAWSDLQMIMEKLGLKIPDK